MCQWWEDKTFIAYGCYNFVSEFSISSFVFKFAGYDFENDMMQLAISYEGLKCFQHCERLLDFRNSSHKRGGLSGLAKVT